MRIPPRPGTQWQFNPPPGWPAVPADWEPTDGWGGPDVDWPAAPPYWDWWIVPEGAVSATELLQNTAVQPNTQDKPATSSSRNRKLLLAGALAVAVAFAAGALTFRFLGDASHSSTAVTNEPFSEDEHSGGANGADLAYETEWSQTRTRQVYIRSPQCSGINFSEAACLANPGRWVSEPYVTAQRGHVCASNIEEATRLASANGARLTGEILDVAC